jgi:cellobiose transport system permease protein
MNASRKILLNCILICGALVALLPFYFMFLGSFKSTAEIFSIDILRLPKVFRYQNYVELFRDADFGRALLNSSVISVSYVSLIIFFATLSGFAFAKFDFPGKNVFFVVMLATMMIPPQIGYIPLFMLMSKMKLANTYFAVVVPRLLHDFGLPFTVFLMRQYSSYIPDDVINSAKIDGCNKFSIYVRIALPMVKPGILVVGLIVFMACWNDFMWPLIIINRKEMYTVSLTIARLFGTSERCSGVRSWQPVHEFSPPHRDVSHIQKDLYQRHYSRGNQIASESPHL